MVKRILAVVLCVVMLLTCLTACGGGGDEAVEFPTETVNCIVPYSAGGGTDLMVRAVAGNIDLDGQTMIATNIEGANSLTGTYECYNGEADGYTLLSIALETIVAMYMSGTIEEELYSEFTPICSVVEDANVIAVASKSQWQTFDDFVAYAKEAGAKCTIASTSRGGSNEFFTYGLADTAGYSFTYVPYDGGAKSRTAVLSGENDAVVCQVSEIKALVDSGEMRVLGVSAEERTQFFDAPTFKEQGYDIVFGLHRSIWAPPGVDADIQKYLTEACGTACATEECTETFLNLGYEPIYTDAEGLAALVEETKEKLVEWSKLI